jgi:Mg2+/citrate symporter
LLVAFKVRGGDATAVIGGTTLLLLTVFVLTAHRGEGFNIISEHLVKGFSFGVRIFAPVVIIASFFYLGSPEISKQVFGDGSRGLLFDLAEALSRVIPLNRVSVGLMQSTVGIIVGLDGSGFSGLPLTGSLAGAFAPVAELRTGTITALGQIATVWAGGGCIIPWGVVAVAAVCRVSPQELAAKNIVPVLLGLTATTVVAIFLM